MHAGIATYIYSDKKMSVKFMVSVLHGEISYLIKLPIFWPVNL